MEKSIPPTRYYKSNIETSNLSKDKLQKQNKLMEYWINLRLFITLSLLYCLLTPILAKQPKRPADPIYDALGIVSYAMKCGNHYYHKRYVYAAVNQACSLLSRGQKLKGECPFGRSCVYYPKKFQESGKLKFALNGPYHAFPLHTMGRIYHGNTPRTKDMVIFDSNCDVAGGHTRGFTGHKQLCIIDVDPPRVGSLDN